jgi:tellurite resistance protein TerC
MAPVNELEPSQTPERFGARTLRQGRRVAIFLLGSTVLLLGVLLLVLPGPGLPLVIGGLAILAIEFAWARRWLRRGKVTGKVYRRSLRRRFRGR